jgi:hypothetical protein
MRMPDVFSAELAPFGAPVQLLSVNSCLTIQSVKNTVPIAVPMVTMSVMSAMLLSSRSEVVGRIPATGYDPWRKAQADHISKRYYAPTPTENRRVRTLPVILTAPPVLPLLPPAEESAIESPRN